MYFVLELSHTRSPHLLIARRGDLWIYLCEKGYVGETTSAVLVTGVVVPQVGFAHDITFHSTRDQREIRQHLPLPWSVTHGNSTHVSDVNRQLGHEQALPHSGCRVLDPKAPAAQLSERGMKDAPRLNEILPVSSFKCDTNGTKVRVCVN